ncbi:MAG: endolytic transglycosylase MltG, partial [Firmicutes bacterium]|nr:endolytic transglycosylase MltG [Bacillota bacterium]
KTEQVLVIEQGSSVADIAATLANAGIIDSEAQFIYLCKREGRGSSFQPGEYTFNNYMDFYEICDTLESGYVKQECVTITIREGMWAKEIAKQLE